MSKPARWDGYALRESMLGRMYHLVDDSDDGSALDALCGCVAPRVVDLPARPQSSFDILRRLCGNCNHSAGLRQGK